ncbi:MAG: hypothetical protein QOI35_1597 [Cryptosporangiaceae bacterium]|nr:hypothetical protein [Cryptosporangiaceae bacterium]
MQIRLLGAVQFTVGGQPVSLGPRKQRLIAGVLALEAGRQVGVHRLVELLWPTSPPSSAAQSVRVSVSRLRSALAVAGPQYGAIVRTEGSGYLLDVDPSVVDAHEFRRLVRAAAQAPADAERIALLDAALDLWQGSVLAGDVPAECRERLCQSLDEARLTAVEDRCAAALRLGDHASLPAELGRWVAEHPLRERMRAQLMHALYRCGQRAEALAVHRAGRALLVEELGLEPGPELAAMERAILADDPALLPAAGQAPAASPVRAAAPHVPAAAVPAQLPAAVADFTGREPQLRRLDQVLAGAGTAALVATITGTAGIGKTSLCLQWAHRIAPQFPGGQLYINLRGFDPGGAVAPTDAVQGFLRGLGVPGEQIPSALADQTALYRSMLAGKRVLVMLDNARDAEQVRPLLPGSPGCVAVVTSRNQLTGLVARDGARPVGLDLLAADDARSLLARRIGPERVLAEPSAAAEIVARCAGLPLALVIVAARAAMRPSFPLSALAAELGAARSGLEPFADADGESDVRAVFSWSYDRLSEPAAALFRQLGLIPGAAITRPAAAAMTGGTEREVAAALAELTGASLVTEHLPGRFGFHDLLRAYASELAHRHDPADRRSTALHRLLDHYLHSALAASAQVEPNREPARPGPPPPVAPVVSFTGLDHAQAWLTAERSVLLDAIAQAAESGFDPYGWQLAWAMTGFLQRHGHWNELRAAHETALASAQRTGDVAGQIYSHRGFSRLYFRLGNATDALDHLNRALALSGGVEDDVLRGRIHGGLAFASELNGDLPAAFDHAVRAHDYYCRAGHAPGEAEALNALGWTCTLLGRYTESLDYCRRSLDLLRKMGDVDNQATALDSLGFAHHHLGEYPEAIACFQAAIALFEKVGERFLLAETRTHLADTYAAGGQFASAQAEWELALELLHALGHPAAAEVSAKLTRLRPPPPSGPAAAPQQQRRAAAAGYGLGGPLGPVPHLQVVWNSEAAPHAGSPGAAS